MRITKRVREEAAMICAISASTPTLAEAYILVAVELGWTLKDRRGRVTGQVNEIRRAAYELALKAWEAADDKRLGRPFIDAEAEAMLRTGWVP